jgi:ectoine hydroxylase-related dioxygenase (phytanoyl-CoA dioxygenase family)
MEGINRFLSPQQKEEFRNKVPIEMKKGYATFHHPLMVHGSYENTSSHARRAFVLNVFADGTRSDTDEEILRGVPVIRKGQKLEGKFFPLLYEPQ